MQQLSFSIQIPHKKTVLQDQSIIIYDSLILNRKISQSEKRAKDDHKWDSVGHKMSLCASLQRYKTTLWNSASGSKLSGLLSFSVQYMQHEYCGQQVLKSQRMKHMCLPRLLSPKTLTKLNFIKQGKNIAFRDIGALWANAFNPLSQQSNHITFTPSRVVVLKYNFSLGMK